MPVVLICAPEPISADLRRTVLWRDGVERHIASRVEDALAMALAIDPGLIVIDHRLDDALRLLQQLRADPPTRTTSIAMLVHGHYDGAELQLLQAGANALIRLPASPHDEDRLSQLMLVAARRAARLPVRLQMEGHVAYRTTQRPVLTLWATVLNLSATGMFVETSVALDLGAEIDFQFRLSEGAETISGRGQIMRQSTPNRYGIRFHGLDGDGTSRVQRFVEDIGPGGMASPGRKPSRR